LIFTFLNEIVFAHRCSLLFLITRCLYGLSDFFFSKLVFVNTVYKW
jgi:hypothetical protein